MPIGQRLSVVLSLSLLAAACGGSNPPVESSGSVDLVGYWMYSDSSWLPDPSNAPVQSNDCAITNRPVRIIVEPAWDSAYVGTELRGGTSRCEIDGVLQPETGLDAFVRIQYPIFVNNGRIVMLANDYRDTVLYGEIVNERLIRGTRLGYYDGRPGKWKLER